MTEAAAPDRPSSIGRWLGLGWAIVVINLAVAIAVAWGTSPYWWQWFGVACNVAVAIYTWRVTLPRIRRLRTGRG